jgi:NADH:ubiquinone oxidoreductase subunit 5 (subunit L)/multisubunit Na+/H+ antiporter MnhA subunit
LNTIFEIDLKKLIALSTLRHLGFIGIAFSVGLLHLSFFHLLVHALFKSLLFMTIGDIIINLNHSQDIRYLSKGGIYTPFSSLIINISILNLLGIPNLRGFFSKDLVLESLNYSNVSIFFTFVLYTNVVFTYYYSYKLFFYSFQSIKLNPYQLFHSLSFIHSCLIVFLSTLTLFFAIIFIDFIFHYIIYYSVIYSLKFLPLLLNISIFIYLLLFLVLPTIKSKYVFSFFSSILFLRNLAITFTSQFYYNFLFKRVKSIEIGFLNFSINKILLDVTSPISSFIFKRLLKVNITSLALFSFLFFILSFSFIL